MLHVSFLPIRAIGFDRRLKIHGFFHLTHPGPWGRRIVPGWGVGRVGVGGDNTTPSAQAVGFAHLHLGFSLLVTVGAYYVNSSVNSSGLSSWCQKKTGHARFISVGFICINLSAGFNFFLAS